MIDKHFSTGNLAHCAIFVKDLAVTLNFYCDILGFKQCGKYHDDTVFLSLGTMVLEIICDGKDHIPENRNEKRHLAICCKHIESLYEYLKFQKIEIEEPGLVTLNDFGKKGCKYILFRGPEQERLEFQEIL